MATGTLTTLDFRGTTLFAVERPEGVFVAIAPICDGMGIDARRQRERIQDDDVLREGLVMLPIPSAGGTQETACLRLSLVPGWLFSIEVAKVREEARDAVLAYKRECHEVLFQHFYARNRGKEELSLRDKAFLVDKAERLFGVDAGRQMWFKLGLPSVEAIAAQGSLFPRAAEGGAA